MPTAPIDVRFQGQPGRHVLMLSSSQFDPSGTFALSALERTRKSAT
jgi:hypothetical protein